MDPVQPTPQASQAAPSAVPPQAQTPPPLMPPQQSSTPSQPSFNWKLTLSLLGAFVLVLALFIGGSYLFGVKQYDSATQATPTVAQIQKLPTPTPVASISATANWKTYEDSVWRISFKYPPGWEKVNHKGGEGDNSGDLIKTLDLQMTSYSSVKNGAFVYGPYAPGVLPYSWEKLFDGYENDQVQVLNNGTMVDGQETKIGLIKKTNAVEMIVYYKYPTPFTSGDQKIQWSFVSLVTSPSTFENYNKTFYQILSTFKFTDATPSAR